MPDTHSQEARPQSFNELDAALRLACELLADGPQSKEEANTADGWRDVFLTAARTGQSPREVIASTPPPRQMTESERRALQGHFNVDAPNARLTA